MELDGGPETALTLGYLLARRPCRLRVGFRPLGDVLLRCSSSGGVRPIAAPGKDFTFGRRVFDVHAPASKDPKTAGLPPEAASARR